jgi:hypothetical protein
MIRPFERAGQLRRIATQSIREKSNGNVASGGAVRWAKIQRSFMALSGFEGKKVQQNSGTVLP